jgi:hypothetical protein
LRCRARGKTSIWDNTVSKRSGNVRLKKRTAGVVPHIPHPFLEFWSNFGRAS